MGPNYGDPNLTAALLDIDFLVPNPAKFKTNVDVSKMLNQLGFDSDFDYSTGLVKYVHTDLEIQFLTPALGRVKDTPHENIRALAQKMAADHVQRVKKALSCNVFFFNCRLIAYLRRVCPALEEIRAKRFVLCSE